MNASEDAPAPGPEEHPDAERDLAEHERPRREKPETGLISDEELPEDLRPSDDNPLAKNPGEEEDEDADRSTRKVEGMPDMGSPGPPA